MNQPVSTPKLAMNRRGFLQLSGAAVVAGSAFGLGAVSPSFAADGTPVAPSGDPGSLTPVYPGAPYSPGFFTENFENRGENSYGNQVQFAKALLDYDPATDPNAAFVVSHVPLAARVPSRAATQAKPKLDPVPGATELSLPYMPLTSDEVRYASGRGVYTTTYHGNRWDEFQYLRYAWSADVHVPLQHAYRDIMGSWAASWELTSIVFNPSYADMAHRNGQLAIGVVHSPYFGPAAPQTEVDIANAKYSFVAKEGNDFVYARKLVDLAETFGYDGYFLNFEASVEAAHIPRLKEWIAYAKALAAERGMKTFHFQWYDSLREDGSIAYDNSLSERNAKWMTQSPLDTIFLNYWWGASEVAQTATIAAQNGIDAKKRVFFGIEMENARGQDPGKKWGPANLVIPADGAGVPAASIALFDPVQQMVTASRTQATNAADVVSMRKQVRQIERNFWSGPDADPSRGYDPSGNYGAANFFAERSVIGSLPFSTRFNIGSGTQFAIQGRDASANGAWFNAGAQDLLPTWQWWRRVLAGAGAKNASAVLADCDFDDDVAFDGPTSLRISGAAGASATEVRLFKTEIAVPAGATATVVFRTTPGAKLSLGWTFDDGVDDVQWAQLDTTGEGWISREVAVPAGRQLTTISLAAAPAADGETFTINVGELTLRTDATAPAGVQNVKLDNVITHTNITRADAKISWDIAPDVRYYDLTTVDLAGAPVWLGRIYSNVYYLENVPRPGVAQGTPVASSQVFITPVGPNGVAGKAGAATIQWVEDPTVPVNPGTPTTPATPTSPATPTAPAGDGGGSGGGRNGRGGKLPATGLDGGSVLGWAALGGSAVAAGLLARRIARMRGAEQDES